MHDVNPVRYVLARDGRLRMILLGAAVAIAATAGITGGLLLPNRAHQTNVETRMGASTGNQATSWITSCIDRQGFQATETANQDLVAPAQSATLVSDSVGVFPELRGYPTTTVELTILGNVNGANPTSVDRGQPVVAVGFSGLDTSWTDGAAVSPLHTYTITGWIDVVNPATGAEVFATGCW